MLINSVILFLRDALPVLLFISIMCAIIARETESVAWLTKAVLGGVLGIFVVSLIINPVSELFDGFGFELLTVLIHLLAYVSAVLFIFFGKHQRVLVATVATSLLIAIHGTNLFIYFHGFWSMPNVLDALLVGTTLGLGISVSLAILLYYGLRSTLIDSVPKLPLFVLSLAAARQVTEAVYFLIQADWLSAGQPLWNTSKYLSDSSEFGHFFNALTGYEASPSAIQVVMHLVALGLPLLILLKRNSNAPFANKEVTS